MEPERHDPVAEDHRLLLPAMAVDLVDHARDFAFRHQLVDDVESYLRALRQYTAENDPAGRRVIFHADSLAVFADPLPAIFYLGVKGHGAGMERVLKGCKILVDALLRNLGALVFGRLRSE